MGRGEVLTAIEIPLPPAGSLAHFDELARRRGDYAMVGLAAQGARGERSGCKGAAGGSCAWHSSASATGLVLAGPPGAPSPAAGGPSRPRRRSKATWRRPATPSAAARPSCTWRASCSAAPWPRSSAGQAGGDEPAQTPLDNTRVVTLTVNGERVSRSVPARTNLADFLREALDLTGVHVGCEHGVCGACTVRVDGLAVRGCLMLAVQADGAAVETIEGLTDRGAIADCRSISSRATPCSAASARPGMLVTIAELLEREPRAVARGDPRGDLGQLLPLHRLSGHRRCGRADGGGARRRRATRHEPALSFLDRPNSYIGRSVPRPNARRLVQGRGSYVDDLRLPRLAHVAFLRSPHAHARIVAHRHRRRQRPRPA